MIQFVNKETLVALFVIRSAYFFSIDMIWKWSATFYVRKNTRNLLFLSMQKVTCHFLELVTARLDYQPLFWKWARAAKRNASEAAPCVWKIFPSM